MNAHRGLDSLPYYKDSSPNRSLLFIATGSFEFVNLPHKYFDAVISNSLLHHIKDTSALWQTVKNCAKPGAPVFIMDLYRPENIQKTEQLIGIYAKGASPILKKDFYNSLLASYNIDEIIKQLSKEEIHYLNVEIVSDRHILAWGHKK